MAPTTKAAAKATKAPAKAAKTSAKKVAAPAKPRARGTSSTPTTSPSTKASSSKRPAAKKSAPAKKAAPAKKSAPSTKAPAAKKSAPAKKVAPAKKAAPAKTAAPKASRPKAAPASTRSRVIPALAKRVPGANDRKRPPKRKGPLDKFLLGQLEALTQERVTYLRQATSLKAEADMLMAEREPGDVQFDEESGEGDTLAVERERDLALSAQASAAVEEIDVAIAKLHDGTYGVCEQCFVSIPKDRLRALPYAALCVQCKSAGFSRR